MSISVLFFSEEMSTGYIRRIYWVYMAEKHTHNTFSMSLPDEVILVASTLRNAGFDAYIVGGCVRDRILNRSVNDWDFTTNANPEQIQPLFEHTVYENDYGTVGIVFEDAEDPSLKVIEVTPYRKESGYSDNRRPDSVVFGVSLDDDLSRRDFTVNALAYDPVSQELIDRHHGIADLHLGLIRSVGDPDERFGEDALRLMRAARIATQLNADIEERTLLAIQNHSDALSTIATERIRDELIKLLLSAAPAQGVLLLQRAGLLKHIIPELLQGVGVEQNQAHRYDVFEHNVRTLEHAGVKEFSLMLRLSALLHDIGKPETREWSDEKRDWTFHTHEVVGARMAKVILRRLKFPNDLIDTVTMLVRWHMFFSDVEKISLSAVRRMVARVGEEHIWNLIDLRKCDRIGTGRPKEQPYRLRKYVSLVEEVLREPVTPGVLSIDGTVLMREVGISPGPRLGHLLHALLAEVLEDPGKNTRELLLSRAGELSALSDKELATLGERGKLRRFEEEERQISVIRKRHGVS